MGRTMYSALIMLVFASALLARLPRAAWEKRNGGSDSQSGPWKHSRCMMTKEHLTFLITLKNSEELGASPRLQGHHAGLSLDLMHWQLGLWDPGGFKRIL